MGARGTGTYSNVSKWQSQKTHLGYFEVLDQHVNNYFFSHLLKGMNQKLLI